MDLGIQRQAMKSWASWIFLSALFFVLPFTSSNRTVEHELSIRFFLFSVIVSFSYIYILFHSWNKRDEVTFIQTTSGKFWLLFIFFGFISCCFSLNIREAFAENLKNVLGFGCAFSTYHFLRCDSSFIKKFAIVSSVFLVGILLVGGYQAIFQVEFFRSYKELVSTLSNPNLFSSILVVSIPFVYILYHSQSNRLIKIMAILLGICVVVFVFLIKSKSSILALGVGLSSFAVLCIYVKSPFHSSRFVIYSAIVFSVFLVLACVYIWTNYSYRLNDLLFFNSAKEESFDGNIERILLWKNSMKMILEFPFLGVGPGHWKLYFPKYGISGWYLDKSLIQFSTPHNDYLWICSEYGLLGFLAFISLILFTIKGYWEKIRKVNDTEFLTYLALLSGFIAFLSDSFFSYPRERPIHIILFAIYIALGQSQNMHRANNRYSKFILVGLLVGSFLSIYVFYFRFIAEFNLKRARDARDAKAWEVCFQEAERAEKLGLDYAPFYLEPIVLTQGMALDEMGQLNIAYKYYESAYKSAPYHLYSMVQYAGALYASGNEVECIRLLDQTLKITPGFWFSWRLRSLIFLRKNNIESAWRALNSSSWNIEAEYNELSREIFKARLISAYETLPEGNQYLDCLKRILEEDSIPPVIEKQYHSEEGVMKWLYNFGQLFCK